MKLRGPITLLRTSRQFRRWTFGLFFALLLYAASIGPAIWLETRGLLFSRDSVLLAYAPIVFTWENSPPLFSQPIGWYTQLWMQSDSAPATSPPRSADAPASAVSD